jgi:hypothetical protein
MPVRALGGVNLPDSFSAKMANLDGKFEGAYLREGRAATKAKRSGTSTVTEG